MAVRKKKATKKAAKKATKKKASRTPVRAKTPKADAAPEATEEKSPPAPPPAKAGSPSQSAAEDKDAGRIWRLLVQVDNPLYVRLRAIAQRENALFPADEELSVAQQAAVLLEAGLTMWEEDGEQTTGDGYLDDPDYSNALSAAMTGRVMQR